MVGIGLTLEVDELLADARWGRDLARLFRGRDKPSRTAVNGLLCVVSSTMAPRLCRVMVLRPATAPTAIR